jgi:glutamate-1-semialdehyde 2,1-aminomutase
VRFTNSGSEAATLAARIARRATGRRTLVLCERGYHGSGPDFLDETSETHRIPFGAVEALSTIDDTVAAVFVEPFLGSGGVIPAPAGYLAAVAAACRRSGAVFVLDEVQSLRCAFSGLHGELGLAPDLVLMGKVIGGGLPVGAVGGSAALLDLTASSRDGALPHSGTFNGNPLVCAAGAVALRHLDAEAIDALNRRAARLAEALEAAGREAGRPVRVTACGSILQVHPEAAGDIAALHLALLTEGVYAAPRGMLNLSTALGDDALAAVAERYARAFRRLAEAA